MRSTEAVAEGRRVLELCNACRYCEGFCAVFPAMELRRSFTNGDLGYIANLCHDCRACYYACQYAPPHEFALNLPQAMSRLREETYAEYAWPRALAGLFRRNGTVVSLVAAFGIALVLVLAAALQWPAILYQPHSGSGAFYAVIPEWLMITVGGITFGFGLLALAMGFRNFWRDTGASSHAASHGLGKAVADVLTLRYLGGGGDGCNTRNEAFSEVRRYAHQALFYGFGLCFLSTCTAAIYEHILGRVAPYPFLSLPVLLGTVGGIAMLLGAGGLLSVKSTSDPAPAAKSVLGADYALLILLFLAAATGLLLLVSRASAAMGMLLTLHLGVILSFFVVLPYSKFVHGVYRSAALLRHAAERSVRG